MSRVGLRLMIGAGLAGLALLPACRRDPLDEGSKALELRQLKRAEPLLELAASRQPGDASAQANLGIVYLKLGRADPALAAFRRAAELAPDDPRPLEFIAALRAEQGRWKDAADVLVSALRRDPKSPRVMTAMAVAELHVYGPQAARTRLNDTLVFAPNYSPALFDLALIEKDWLQEPEAAEALFRRYLKLTPGGERAADARTALQESGLPPSPAPRKQRPRAGLASDKQDVAPVGRAGTPSHESPPPPRPAARNAPAAADAYNKGVRSHTAGDLDQAAEAYGLAIENDPGMVNAYYNLGLVYKAKGEPAKAKSAFQQAVNLAPDLINARYMLALLHQEQHDDAAAITELTALVQKAPQHAEAHLALGLLYKKDAAKADLARKELARYLDLKPDGASAQTIRTWLKVRR